MQTKSNLPVYLLRGAILAACLAFISGNRWPPLAGAQSYTQEQMETEKTLGEHSQAIDQINSHLAATDGTIQRQWQNVQKNSSDIGVIQAVATRDDWWIGLIGLLVSGSIVFQVKGRKG